MKPKGFWLGLAILNLVGGIGLSIEGIYKNYFLPRHYIEVIVCFVLFVVFMWLAYGGEK